MSHKTHNAVSRAQLLRSVEYRHHGAAAAADALQLNVVLPNDISQASTSATVRRQGHDSPISELIGGFGPRYNSVIP